jgi:hypothetical protein
VPVQLALALPVHLLGQQAVETQHRQLPQLARVPVQLALALPVHLLGQQALVTQHRQLLQERESAGATGSGSACTSVGPTGACDSTPAITSACESAGATG